MISAIRPVWLGLRERRLPRPRWLPGTSVAANAALVGAIKAPPTAAPPRDSKRLQKLPAVAAQNMLVASNNNPAEMIRGRDQCLASINCASGAVSAKAHAKTLISQPAAPGATANLSVISLPAPRTISEPVPTENIARDSVQSAVLGGLGSYRLLFGQAWGNKIFRACPLAKRWMLLTKAASTVPRDQDTSK